MPSYNNVLSLNGSIKNTRHNNVNSGYTATQRENEQPVYVPNLSNSNNFQSDNINLEKTAIELSLNILGMEHNLFESMPKHEFLYYYDNYKKQNNNVNKVLAAKIAYKYKMSCCDDVNSGYNNVYNQQQQNQQNQVNQQNQSYGFYQPQQYNGSGGFLQQSNGNNRGTSNNFINTIQGNPNNQNIPLLSQPNIYEPLNRQIEENQVNNYNVQSHRPTFTHTSHQNTVQNPQTFQTKPTKNINDYNQQSNLSNQQNYQQNPQQFSLTQMQQNFRPTQQNKEGSNKYLASPEALAKIPTSKEFDVSGIIDNYVRQKNYGGRNIDSSNYNPNSGVNLNPKIISVPTNFNNLNISNQNQNQYKPMSQRRNLDSSF